MEIPTIQDKNFEDVYLESISEQLRISIEDLKEKINSKDTASLNKKQRDIFKHIYLIKLLTLLKTIGFQLKKLLFNGS